MARTLPTRRLTEVLLEASTILRALQVLQGTVRHVVQDWGNQPSEAALAELRIALDNAVVPMPAAIPEAIGYLKATGTKLASSRRRQRRLHNFAPTDEYVPPEISPDTAAGMTAITPEEMEKLLGSLDLSSDG